MLSLLLMKKASEQGIKVKDFMNHLIPKYDKASLYQYLDLVHSSNSEDLIVLYNPSLDYVDTTLI